MSRRPDRPRLLDLFCGAGGASVGYARAGFEVHGVDINPQPNYPFPFRRANALAFPLDGYDVIHASPPCQAYSIARYIKGRTDHPDLIAVTRRRLQASGALWIMENVPGAPMDERSVTVCGRTLGLGVKRHRLFESNVALSAPPCPKGHPGGWVTVMGHVVLARKKLVDASPGRARLPQGELPLETGRRAMGISWMNQSELSEAIPPAYTAMLGEQLLVALRALA